MKRVIKLSETSAVALVDNSQGIRILAGVLKGNVMEDNVTLARTKTEAKDLINKLRDLMQDLPS